MVIEYNPEICAHYLFGIGGMITFGSSYGGPGGTCGREGGKGSRTQAESGLRGGMRKKVK